MSQPTNFSTQGNQSQPNQTPDSINYEYRMVNKKYFCHVCQREFKKMSPALELVEVECPQCHQTFCEEFAANSNQSSPRQEPRNLASSANNNINSQMGNRSSQSNQSSPGL